MPVGFEDADRIDGSTRLQAVLKIYLPIIAPGISATAILGSVRIWNELVIALAITFYSVQTITSGVAGFRGYASIDIGAMTAASIVSIMPMALLGAFAQTFIVEGLTIGAIK